MRAVCFGASSNIPKIESMNCLGSSVATFQKQFYGIKPIKSEVEYDPKKFTEHVLTEGTIVEKRELLSNLKNKVVLKNKVIYCI